MYNKWGFDGHVVSDCGAIFDLSRTYKVARNDAEAEAMEQRETEILCKLGIADPYSIGPERP